MKKNDTELDAYIRRSERATWIIFYASVALVISTCACSMYVIIGVLTKLGLL